MTLILISIFHPKDHDLPTTLCWRTATIPGPPASVNRLNVNSRQPPPVAVGSVDVSERPNALSALTYVVDACSVGRSVRETGTALAGWVGFNVHVPRSTICRFCARFVNVNPTQSLTPAVTPYLQYLPRDGQVKLKLPVQPHIALHHEFLVHYVSCPLWDANTI